jgi:class 3 adenylate cyclase
LTDNVPVARQLAAILAADIVGFSRLVGRDETGTLAALRQLRREIVDPLVAKFGGCIFKTTGDGVLSEFPSAVMALEAAIGIQEQMRAQNPQAPVNAAIEFRIGVHAGDFVVEGEDLLGDGVNIAARLEAMAEPGGICISARVFEDASGRIALDARDMGELALKNMATPVRAYAVQVDASAGAQRPVQVAPTAPPRLSIIVLPSPTRRGS